MFLSTDFDQHLLNERVTQFRDQTQRYASMLRLAVPYGFLTDMICCLCSDFCSLANAKSIPEVLEEIPNTYLDLRLEQESFLEIYKRVSIQPFKERAYADIN